MSPDSIDINERGASMFVVAMAMLLLMGAAAIAVDLAAMRLDRSVDQKITDSAAAAGALTVRNSGTGQDACLAALGYVEANTAGIDPGDLIDPLNPTACVPLASSCDASTPARTTVPITAGRFTVSVTHPVPDLDALMTSGQLGVTSPQAVVAEDGEQCDRVGVQMSAVHEGLIAGILGFDQGTTTVHTVARAEFSPPEGTPINLLLLDRFGCGALQVEGNGGVIVDAIYDPDNDVLIPGVAAVDSDGSNYGSPCDSSGTINVQGSNSLLRSDGPTCVDQSGTATHSSGKTKGLGCGLTQTVAPGTPGCAGGGANLPACSPGAGGSNPPEPEATGLPQRLTRAPIDHRYNCRSSYDTIPSSIDWATEPLTAGNEQDIPGCTEGNPAYIHDLIDGVTEMGPPPTGVWKQWSAWYPCDLPSSHPPIPESGNWWIDCASFNVRTTVTITDGDVVADGSINTTSSTGVFTVDNVTGGTPGFLFLRNGILLKDGQASLILRDTTVYASENSSVSMAGGTGTLIWQAPNVDGYRFDDLALWSDGGNTHFWAGQANLTMSGVFFTPLALADYSGTGGQNQTDAQFIADRLVARGQGQLVVAPVFGHSVEFNPPPRSVLLR